MRFVSSTAMSRHLVVLAIAGMASAASADFVLSSRNLNNLSLGNLATDTTGAVAGQDGWYIFNSSTAAGRGAPDFQIVSDPSATHGGDKVLRVQAGTTGTGNNVTRFAWNDDIHTNWSSNLPGHNTVELTYDFYMGGASTTSTNRYGVYMYDASGSKILAGATLQNNTGQLYIVGSYNNAGTIGNFSFSTGTAGLLSRNTWYKLKVTFDVSTGRFQGGFSADGGSNFSMFYVDGAAAGIAPDEYDLIGSVNSGTNAQGSTYGYYDNFDVRTVPAPSAVAALGLGGLMAARRRRTAAQR